MAWGLFPIYWKLLIKFASIEILAHRVIWSFVFYLAFVVYRTGQPRAWLAIFRDRRHARQIVAASILLTSNWVIYIWAVNSGHVVHTSLGYFISPILSVFLGRVVLKEKLSLAGWIAVALAATGVLVLAVQSGQAPWISISLALTFGLYSLIRKRLAIDVFLASTAESAVMLLPALALFLYFRLAGHGPEAGPADWLLLLGSGIVTGLPLIWFVSGARRLPLSTLSFFQYIAPSMQFLLGVFAFHEPFGATQLVAFAFIWTALALSTWNTLHPRRT